MARRRFCVSGRVQGVFFRASAREQARHLGLGGWAANCADGRVEVVARGSTEALRRFGAWLAEGPRMARVAAVTCEATEIETPDTFEVR